MLKSNTPGLVQRSLSCDCANECASTCYELVEVTPIAVLDRIEEMWDVGMGDLADPGYVGAVRKLWVARITATGALCWVAEYTDADGVFEAECFAGSDVSKAWDHHRPADPAKAPTPDWADVEW
jgi:hypothetical protein